ncbi:glycoside hydrolase family 43 protein [Oleiharenicola lentus]|uniref:glycoside hydrolase family 43 protein n=1 Tax=Oleiharenicola lentus TaxID=2508720 RepID=UPI003F66FD07
MSPRPRFLSLFILCACVCASLTASHAADSPSFPNPFIEQRADPWIYRHTDGYAYFMGTVPEYDRLVLRRAKTLHALPAAPEKTIWRKHPAGTMGAHIWAPEIHFIDGKWYVYFAAGASDKIWEIRIYVLENAAANPLEGEWVEKGQLKTGWESFALDASTFEHRGTRYLLWTQRHPDIKGTNLYIAKMDTPWSISTPAVLLSKPEFPWEQIRYWVNEGPTVLHRNGRLFLTYSAAGTGAEYCLGLLTADENADLLNPKSWSKSRTPVFVSNAENNIFGPGHNCFSTENGVDLLVYHARNYAEISGDPLRDPNRHTRVQPLTWKKDGTPNFGVPAKETTVR